MNQTFDLNTMFFLAILLVIVMVLVCGSQLAFRRSGWSPSRVRRGTLITLMVVLAWLAITGSLAGSGILAQFERQPPPMFPMLLVSTLATLALAHSPFGTRLKRNIGWVGLIGFQTFRIPVELWLHRLYRQGVAPVQMTYEGLNWDILSGLSALVFAVIATQGRLSKGWIWAWNLVSLALLINIVTVAVLSMPVAFRTFHNEPANTFVTFFPQIWLPTVMVQAALFGHLLVFRKLASLQHLNP